jgi:hypothetical protein
MVDEKQSAESKQKEIEHEFTKVQQYIDDSDIPIQFFTVQQYADSQKDNQEK